MALRVSIGAGRWRLVQLVVIECAWLAFFAAGIAACFASWAAPSVRFIESLLFEVKATDVGALALPTVTILAVALLAALPAVIRAVRIDPVTMLRSE